MRSELTRGYAVTLMPVGLGAWQVHVPDLPGCEAELEGGLDEVIGGIGELIDVWRHDRTVEGFEVMEPSAHQVNGCSGRLLVRVPPSVHLALIRLAERDRVSVNTVVLVALVSAVVEGLARPYRTYARSITGPVNRTRYLQRLRREGREPRRR